MKTPIKLQRSLSLQGWRVTGTIAFATKREWEPALLKLAVQHGSVTPEIVVRDLLGGRSSVARRLLQICTGLGLLEAQRHVWFPTDAGRRAAQTGLVLIPERGTWILWGAEDPLLPSPIVAATPWREPSALDERTRDTQRSFQKLPAWLTTATGTLCESLAGEHRALRIDDLGKEQRGEPVDGRPSLRLTFTIAPAEVRVRVTGQLEGDPVDTDVPAPNLSHDETWTTLLWQAGLGERWDAHRRALWVAFKETSEPERSSLKRAVRFEQPHLSRFGRFDPATVEHVPLRPWSNNDAVEWAEWRLVQGIKGYLVGDKLEAAYRDAVAPFEDIAPPCPTREALAKRVRGEGRPPPHFWRLQAPADWTLDGRRIR